MAFEEGATGSPPRGGGGFQVFGARVETSRLAPGLHVVATPIGNLGDITLRALGVLAAADVVLAEDTRVTRVLLDHYGIATPMAPYHEHNAAAVRPHLMERLARGEALALVSDAGTPLVSDPGYKLVQAAVAAGHAATVLPGASAVLAGLTLAGLPTDRFFFEGFLPPKSGARQNRIADLAAVPGTLVFFESPRRLSATLADLAAVLGARPAAVARELTKRFEEVRRGALPSLAAAYAQEEEPKGEIVILVGPPEDVPRPEAADLDRELAEALRTLSVKSAAGVVAARYGLPRRDLYARALALAEAREGGA